MNKRASSVHASPGGRSGKKRKSGSTAGSQTESSPVKANAPILDPGTLPFPKKVDLFQQMSDIYSVSSDDCGMEEQHLIDCSAGDEEKNVNLQLPQLPAAHIEDEPTQTSPASEQLLTSDDPNDSTEYQTSEMEMPSDAPEVPPTPHENVETLIAMMKEMTPESLNENKNEILKRLNNLQMDSSGLSRATLEPDLVDTLKDRLRSMERGMECNIVKIPGPRWLMYREQLMHMVEDKPIATMDFEQRLWAVMDIVYLPEELDALETGNWERLEAAIRTTAAMAEVIGPEDEVVPDKVETWAQSKCKDIAWLKKVAVIRSRYVHDVDTDMAMEE